MSKLAGSHRDASPHRNWKAFGFQFRGDSPWWHLIFRYQLLAGIVLALFWLRSGLAHVTNSYYFLSSIYSYEIVAPTLGVVAAMGFPVVSIDPGRGPGDQVLRGGALFLSSALLAIFAGMQVSVLARGAGHRLWLLRRLGATTHRRRKLGDRFTAVGLAPQVRLFAG